MHKLCYEEQKMRVKQRGPENKNNPIRLCDRKQGKESHDGLAKTWSVTLQSSYR